MACWTAPVDLALHITREGFRQMAHKLARWLCKECLKKGVRSVVFDDLGDTKDTPKPMKATGSQITVFERPKKCPNCPNRWYREDCVEDQTS